MQVCAIPPSVTHKAVHTIKKYISLIITVKKGCLFYYDPSCYAVITHTIIDLSRKHMISLVVCLAINK